MSIGIWAGFLIGGLLAAAMAGLRPNPRLVPRLGEKTKVPNDIDCQWCDRTIHLPLRACTTICDHELKHLALAHPDEICRARLQEFEYQFFGESRTGRPTQEPE